MQLKKSLAANQEALARRTRKQQQQHGRAPGEDDLIFRNMAEKDYHIATQLGESVSENQKLRRTMGMLDEMHGWGTK
jgi:hypothetical protein